MLIFVVLALCKEFPWPFNVTTYFVTDGSSTESGAMYCMCILFKWQQPDSVMWKYWLWICYGLIHLSLLCFLSLSRNIRSSLLNDGSFHLKQHSTENGPIHQLTLLVCEWGVGDCEKTVRRRQERRKCCCVKPHFGILACYLKANTGAALCFSV